MEASGRLRKTMSVDARQRVLRLQLFFNNYVLCPVSSSYSINLENRTCAQFGHLDDQGEAKGRAEVTNHLLALKYITTWTVALNILAFALPKHPFPSKEYKADGSHAHAI